MVMLSIATSIDALAVGLSLAFLGVTIWFPSIVIGIVALAMTAVGMIFGKLLISATSKKGISLSSMQEGFEEMGFSAIIYPDIGNDFGYIHELLAQE